MVDMRCILGTPKHPKKRISAGLNYNVTRHFTEFARDAFIQYIHLIAISLDVNIE
jgi:hypothetical protein